MKVPIYFKEYFERNMLVGSTFFIRQKFKSKEALKKVDFRDFHIVRPMKFLKNKYLLYSSQETATFRSMS